MDVPQNEENKKAMYSAASNIVEGVSNILGYTLNVSSLTATDKHCFQHTCSFPGRQKFLFGIKTISWY